MACKITVPIAEAPRLAPSQPRLPVLDLTAARDYFNDDVGLLLYFCDMFLADCPDTLAAVGKAVQERDAWQLMMAAHKFAGAASQFAARESTADARKLEDMARSGNLAEVEPAYEAFIASAARLLKAMAGLKDMLATAAGVAQIPSSESIYATVLSTIVQSRR